MSNLTGPDPLTHPVSFCVRIRIHQGFACPQIMMPVGLSESATRVVECGMSSVRRTAELTFVARSG